MKIRLENDALTGELSVPARPGCIAYSESASGAIEAIRPHLFGKNESEMIRTLVERRQSD
jgi:hypothetical protein